MEALTPSLINRPKAWIGIDPGAQGSLALVVPTDKHVEFYSTTEEPLEIIRWLVEMAEAYDIQVIMIEDVHSIHGTSARSNFNFGYNVGAINSLAKASGCKVDHITPKIWQKIIGVTEKGKAIKKEVGAIAETLYPDVVVRGPRGGLKDGLSDALCIAHVAYLKHNQTD